MKHGQKAFSAALLFTLSACAVLSPVELRIGEPEATVIAKLGKPTAVIPDGQDHLLEYSRNPWGQAIDMARIGRDGRLVSYEQVLTTEKFAVVQVGRTTKMDILRMFGHPFETVYLPRQQLEAWSYPYKEQGVWNSIMHIHFDSAGVVRRMENGQDLRFERDGRFGFGF